MECSVFLCILRYKYFRFLYIKDYDRLIVFTSVDASHTIFTA